MILIHAVEDVEESPQFPYLAELNFRVPFAMPTSREPAIRLAIDHDPLSVALHFHYCIRCALLQGSPN